MKKMIKKVCTWWKTIEWFPIGKFLISPIILFGVIVKEPEIPGFLLKPTKEHWISSELTFDDKHKKYKNTNNKTRKKEIFISLILKFNWELEKDCWEKLNKKSENIYCWLRRNIIFWRLKRRKLQSSRRSNEPRWIDRVGDWKVEVKFLIENFETNWKKNFERTVTEKGLFLNWETMSKLQSVAK